MSKRDGCDIELHGHGRRSPASVLRELADYAEANGLDADVYGHGAAIRALEERVASLLGKPAAVFMPSGTMAQQIALRIWADRTGCRHIGLHPTSHLDADEHRGYALLHGLHATLIGDPTRVIEPADLQRCGQRLSSLVVELPARRIGGQLPSFEALQELRRVATERGVRLHLDGARLWEAAAGFDRSHAAICELFDSVYVSVYKGIGAWAGALLAGPEDLIAEARIWQRRHGGNLPTLAPFVIGTLARLDERIGRMPAYRERALVIASHVRGLPGVHLVPDPPQTNLFHVHFDGPRESWAEARDRVADQHEVWLFGHLRHTAVGCATELYIGEAALAADPERVQAAWRALVAR